MMSQNVSELLGASMAKVREMVDANTVVGTPISTGDGTTLIPISNISDRVPFPTCYGERFHHKLFQTTL